MKKLLFLLALLSALTVSSCATPNNDNTNTDAPKDEAAVIVPPFSDIGREKINFAEIAYSRPDTEAIISELYSIEEALADGNITYDELLKKILAADKNYSVFDTMHSLLMLKTSADISDTALAEEYETVSAQAPKISRALEELFVALARSEYAERLEAQVFGEGFIEEYKNGSKYNDKNISLLEREAELEAEYLALSPATVKITFEGKTDTYENILGDIKKKYEYSPIRYRLSLSRCEELYTAKLNKKSSDIFIELLKIRQQIAVSYGFESYAEYAYAELGHDYTPEQMKALIDDIAKYAVPIYSSLRERAFAGYFKTHRAPSLERGDAINNIYSALTSLDGDISDVYSYMLNCGLYDIEGYSESRRTGAFTLHLGRENLPFIFATTYGDTSDYMTVAHEFGHFYDNIKNDGMAASLDLAEVYSQSLELLTLTSFRTILTNEEYKYLYYTEMQSILETLIFQGFYARFEAYAYELSYDEITEERLDALVKKAAEDMKLNTAYLSKLSDVLIVHLIDTPFYVQSYCTSLTASLDIYFAECEEEGQGVKIFKNLIEESDKDFEEAIKEVSLPSPFREDALKELLDSIYYRIIGSHYFPLSPDINNAA